MYVLNDEKYEIVTVNDDRALKLFGHFCNPYMREVAAQIDDGYGQFETVADIHAAATAAADKYVEENMDLEEVCRCIYGGLVQVFFQFHHSKDDHLIQGDVLSAIVYAHPHNSGPYVLMNLSPEDKGRLMIAIPKGSHVFREEKTMMEEQEAQERI